jgi:cephalosporin hydroxylase
MDPREKFDREKREMIAKQGADDALRGLTRDWFDRTCDYRYSYNFTWLGIPIIQYPQDIVAMQELVWRIRPELIIETGVAHGGSLMLSASILELLGGPGRVVGIDIDIRSHNRQAIEAHPMMKRITLLEGSAISDETFARVEELARGKGPTLVILDSNHTHEHVARELELYSRFVTNGSYLIVFDTVIEDMPGPFHDRPWGRGNNPKTAVREFLKTTERFVVDTELESKLLITVAPGGYLRCIRD